MSVICLSSDDEDDCVILDNDDKDSWCRSLQTHQVFIVQNNQSSSYNEEADPFESISTDFANNLGEENMSYNCKNNTTILNKNTGEQYFSESSLLDNNEEISYRSINVSCEIQNLNGHPDSDGIQNKDQLLEDFNCPSNQTVAIPIENEKQGLEEESDNNISQRDQIFDAVKLTSVSTSKSKTDQTLNKCPMLPKTGGNKNNKSISLKVLAEKLAQVLGGSHPSDTKLEQFNRANQEQNLSSIEKTILGVSKGYFKKDSQENWLLGSNTTTQDGKNKSKKRETRRKCKNIQLTTRKSNEIASSAEVPIVQIQSNINQFAQTVAETNTKVKPMSLQTANSVEDIQTSQTKHTMHLLKDSLKTGENIEVSKTRINIDSTVSSGIMKIKGHKTPSPEHEWEPTNQQNVVMHHKTKRKEVRCQQSKRVESKPKIKAGNYTKSTPKNGGPYDNKLKFTFDRRISVYSVSVVLPTEPQPQVENLIVCHNSTHVNNVGNSDEQNCLPCTKSVQELVKDAEETKHVNDTEGNSPESVNHENALPTEMIASNDFRSSSMPFSNMLNFKSSFVNHYNTVFDDETDVLCVEMGYSLLETIEELKNLQNLMETPHNNLSKAIETPQSQEFLAESVELKTAIQTCRDRLYQSKQKFIDNFSNIYDKINLGYIVGTQLKIVFLTAWFMKVFLSITSQSPDLMDILHDVKIKSLDMLSDEIVRWPLICKTFFKDDRQFECDCLLVLEFIKDCLKDQHESNSQSNIGLSEETAVKLQTVAYTTSDDRGNHVISAKGCSLNTKDSMKEVFQSDHYIKRRKSKSGKFKQSPKKSKRSYTTDEPQNPNEKETHENVRPTTPPSIVVAENDANRKITGNTGSQFKMDNIPPQSQTNGKQIHTQYLKEHVSNTNNVEQTNCPITFPSGQELEYQKNQLYVEAQPSPLKPSFESNVCCAHENQYHSNSNYIVKSNSHGHHNIHYYQPYQSHLQNLGTSPLIYSQNHYHSVIQPCNQESLTNQNKIIPASFQYFLPSDAISGNTYNQPIPTRQNREGVEISSCPIAVRTSAYPGCDIVSNTGVTINNYNITNYSPHVSPSL